VSAYLDGGPPRAFAHRGWHIDDLAGLENTLTAFQRAYDEGYRHLETDVRATADGQLVVFHDARLDRVTDASGSLGALPWSEVRAARVGGRESIPLLADLLEALPDARFNIDAKADAAVGPLAELIHRMGVADRVCVVSFSDRRLAALRTAVGPGTAWALGPAETFRLYRAGVVRRRFSTTAVAAQVPMIYRRVPIVTPRFLRTAHAAGLEVHIWTIDDAAEMHRLLDLGVDGIMTDRPDVLRAVLVERGAWQ
jgi:glycerophosphoryl diester phosphodiesterase